MSEEAQRLLLEAQALRARGDLPRAVAFCRRAISAAPSDPSARELLGDLLLEQGDTASGEQAYRDALALRPGWPTAEAKLARLLAHKPPPSPPAGGRARSSGAPFPPEEQAAARPRIEAPLSPPPQPDAPRGHPMPRQRSPLRALFLSLLAPGLGQFHNGQPLKGAAFLLGAILISAALLRPLMRALGAYVSTLTGALSSPGSEDFPLPTQGLLPVLDPAALAAAALWTLLFLALYVYSCVDAYVVAARSGRRI